MTEKNQRDKAAEKPAEHGHDQGDAKPAAAVSAAAAEPGTAAADAEKIAQLTEQLAAAADRILRLRADLDNFRKRKQREVEDARTNATLAAIEVFLPAVDQFQMAMTAIRAGHDVGSVKQGMDMILTTFNRCFAELGIETLTTAGQAFDPSVHEAVATEHSATVPAGHVVREWRPGYRLGDRLLRPAVVVVSDGPGVAAAASSPSAPAAAAPAPCPPLADLDVAAED